MKAQPAKAALVANVEPVAPVVGAAVVLLGSARATVVNARARLEASRWAIALSQARTFVKRSLG